MTEAKRTARDMLELLRGHYLPANKAPGVMFMPEIAAPDSLRRADLLVAPVSVSGQRAARLIGHEVKVTRADVVSELRDPTKADPWLIHCSYWWLVIPSLDLIDGLTIPDEWGIMLPPSGRRTISMTIHREALKLTPVADYGPALSRIAAYTVGRMETVVRQAEQKEAYAEQRATRAERQLDEIRAAGGATHVSPHTKRIVAILAGIANSQKHHWHDNDNIDAAVIAAAADHLALNRVNQDLARHLDRLLETTADPFQYIRKQLAEVRQQVNA